jgi:hypothetical protein
VKGDDEIEDHSESEPETPICSPLSNNDSRKRMRKNKPGYEPRQHEKHYSSGSPKDKFHLPGKKCEQSDQGML